MPLTFCAILREECAPGLIFIVEASQRVEMSKAGSETDISGEWPSLGFDDFEYLSHCPRKYEDRTGSRSSDEDEEEDNQQV